MVISVLSAPEVLKVSRQVLGLPEQAIDLLDDATMGAMARRAAGIHCPCSRATLASVLRESLRHVADDATLDECIEGTIEALIVAGDLLELDQVTTDHAAATARWIFAAPFGFVKRPGGSVYLVGATPDDATPLPPSLRIRVQYQRHCRVLSPGPGEDLTFVLRELELVEIPERVWLRAPKQQSSRALLDEITRRLMTQLPSGQVEDLLLIDPEKPVDYYAGRRTGAKRKTGCFIARRPQAYGAAIWGFAQLQDGALAKFLDFPLKGSRWRGCDLAWHLQMAIDYCRGTPQRYRRRATATGTCLDFFSPLPVWAERRFAIIGRPTDRQHCLTSYEIQESELPAEEAFLQQHLWLSPIDPAREGS